MLNMPYYITTSIHSSNTHCIHESGKVEDSLGDGVFNTIERLRDSQVKIDAARYDHYAGCQRMVNQMRTGTVSRNTILNVLDRRSVHLWVCPVCKYDNLSTNHYASNNPLMYQLNSLLLVF
jgi:hypothetical protein